MSLDMGTWHTTTKVIGDPERIIDVLTDPDACTRWSPIDFEVEELEGKRLRTGSKARISGRVAGRTVSFDVDILEAEGSRLALRATGPVEIDVEYDVETLDQESELHALVSVRSTGGLFGRLIAGATDGLLGAGMLDSAVARIAREAGCPAPALAA